MRHYLGAILIVRERFREATGNPQAALQGPILFDTAHRLSLGALIVMWERADGGVDILMARGQEGGT